MRQPIYGPEPPGRGRQHHLLADVHAPREPSAQTRIPYVPRTLQAPPMNRSYSSTPSYQSYQSHSNKSAQSVAAGRVGGGYGPYGAPQYSRAALPTSRLDNAKLKHFSSSDTIDSSNDALHEKLHEARIAMQMTEKDAEQDEYLHNPNKKDPFFAHFHPLSARGWANVIGLVVILCSIIGFMAAYPIIAFFRRVILTTPGGAGAFGNGGINATGQVPFAPRPLIDYDTPQSAYTRTGFDGQAYEIVFSDEFNHPGRTFWPGDDPFWEAVDLHYWATGDYEWYDPSAAITRNGSLVITMSKNPEHGLNYQSGMVQSWNKMCLTGGYIEVSVSLPGLSTIPGFWPGVWTMGNLGRAGYGATTDGTWPYTYSSCDVGTMKNQTNLDGVTPAAARTSGFQGVQGELSYQPGQRLSACTCPSSASQHPGPNVNVGRGAPEIDILEAQVGGGRTPTGAVSQSMQVAPYDAGYNITKGAPGQVIYNTQNTILNTYRGGVYQQAVSAVTPTSANAYTAAGAQFASYGFEYSPTSKDGFITWQANGQETWTLRSSAIGPNAVSQVGQRLISEEPMSIILNFGMSASFQTVALTTLPFPAEMHIDYVRVYQRVGETNIGCDPSAYPTANYIQNHPAAYSNANLTTWAQAGYSQPVNRLQNGGTCP